MNDDTKAQTTSHTPITADDGDRIVQAICNNYRTIGEALENTEAKDRLIASIDSHYATLSAQLAAMRDANKVMEDALINIGEYWNGDENDRAMSDACHHNRETAAAALARAAALGVKP